MLTDDEIREICDRYELIYNITDNVVFIRSACGRWNIFLRGDEVVNLRHENYRWAKGTAQKTHKKFAENYHDQELETKDFREVVSYIVRHDKKMLRNFKKKTKMDKIFEEIEENQLSDSQGKVGRILWIFLVGKIWTGTVMLMKLRACLQTILCVRMMRNVK